MKYQLKSILVLTVFALFGLNSCGKSSKPQNQDSNKQDTTATDSSKQETSGKIEAKVKKMVQYTKVKNADIDYCDTTWVQIDMIEVSGGDKSICDKINNSIVKSITTDEFPTIDAILHSNDQYSDYSTFKMISMKSIFQDDEMLSIWIQQSEQDCGLTNPNPFTIILNFDLKSGRVVKFDQLVAKENTKAFEKIAGQEFIAKYKSEDFDFKKPSDFKINEKFSISNKGITFYFDLYEIGPRSSGDPEILIPYSKFKDLIVPNSIISKY